MLWSLESVSLPGRRIPRLDGVTLDINEGVTAVLGQSGSGKTSLLNVLVGFELPSSGRLQFRMLKNGKEHLAVQQSSRSRQNPAEPMPAFHESKRVSSLLKKGDRHLAVQQSSGGHQHLTEPVPVFQQTANRLSIFWAPANHGLWPHLTVREHLTTVADDAHAEPNMVDDLLARFDLAEMANVTPNSLSLGEQSRLNVARALCSGARVLVMDEPLSHVDSARSGKYWDIVREQCASREISIVFSTHVPEIVLREACDVICLADGRVSFCGSVTELYERPASLDLARMIGPCNWLTSDEVKHWCAVGPVSKQLLEAIAANSSMSIRPEQLVVENVVDGPFCVTDSTFAGSSGEVELRDDRNGGTRRFVYRPQGSKRHQPGDRVILKLLSLLFLVLVSGCFADSSPQLSIKHESNWMMPPEGMKVPAPRGMTISAANEYLVLDNAGRVLVFDGKGDLTRQWWMPEYSVGKAEGICVLKDGRIAVTDTHYHRVVFFDHEGNVTKMMGKLGSEPGDFFYPVKLTQDPDENIYVTEYDRNNRVQKFRPDGTFVLQFGGTGTEAGQFLRPNGIVWYDHKLYVTDAFNSRIQIFTDEGQFVEILGSSDKIAEVHYPYDIAVDQNGDLFVAEYGAGRISKFNRSGRLLGRYGKSGGGQTEAELRTPWGLAIDQRGRVYVCDTGNRRIVELEL